MYRVVDNNNSLPLPALTQQEDELLLRHKPWIEPPLKMDYPYNLTLGTNVFINSSCTILNPCMVTIGSRTLIGPNVSFYGGVHPLDPAIRNGTDGPQAGREIEVGEDCWIGGHVVILAGVKIGRGSTVGAGSMVTRDVPEMVVVAGNPAKVIEKSTMRMRKQAKQNAGDGQKEKGSENLLTDGRTRFWRLWNIGKGRAVAWTDKKTLESDINPKH
jgi:acetyltransferase-like isoleucine patch superfamily enzyme